LSLCLFSFSFSTRPPRPPLFPTRRSSDLKAPNTIKRTDLRSQVVALLRARIVSGELAMNHVYSAAALAKDMGISITPVREAILRSEEHTSELQSRENLVCRLLLEKKKRKD